MEPDAAARAVLSGELGREDMAVAIDIVLNQYNLNPFWWSTHPSRSPLVFLVLIRDDFYRTATTSALQSHGFRAVPLADLSFPTVFWKEVSFAATGNRESSREQLFELGLTFKVVAAMAESQTRRLLPELLELVSDPNAGGPPPHVYDVQKYTTSSLQYAKAIPEVDSQSLRRDISFEVDADLLRRLKQALLRLVSDWSRLANDLMRNCMAYHTHTWINAKGDCSPPWSKKATIGGPVTDSAVFDQIPVVCKELTGLLQCDVPLPEGLRRMAEKISLVFRDLFDVADGICRGELVPPHNHLYLDGKEAHHFPVSVKIGRVIAPRAPGNLVASEPVMWDLTPSLTAGGPVPPPPRTPRAHGLVHSAHKDKEAVAEMISSYSTRYISMKPTPDHHHVLVSGVKDEVPSCIFASLSRLGVGNPIRHPPIEN